MNYSIDFCCVFLVIVTVIYQIQNEFQTFLTPPTMVLISMCFAPVGFMKTTLVPHTGSEKFLGTKVNAMPKNTL